MVPSFPRPDTSKATTATLLHRANSANTRLVGHDRRRSTATLKTTGAKSGQPREAQIIYFHDGRDAIAIASNYGGTRDHRGAPVQAVARCAVQPRVSWGGDMADEGLAQPGAHEARIGLARGTVLLGRVDMAQRHEFLQCQADLPPRRFGCPGFQKTDA